MIERLYMARYVLMGAILAAVALYWFFKLWKDSRRMAKLEQRFLPKECVVCGRTAEVGDKLCYLHQFGGNLDD